MRLPFLSQLLILGALMFAASASPAAVVEVSSDLNTPVLLAEDESTVYLKVNVRGHEMPGGKRAPVNVAIVLDKSGSMSGHKIQKAREAAIEAVQRLKADDIVSVITYDSTVNVVVPATKLSDRQFLINQIRQIQAGGNTALFGGVNKGAEEVRKFHSEKRMNRIILLSDGLANVGPSSPEDLASLGESLGAEGISVSTIGLGDGYNEDLMAKLAKSSAGNHIFAQEPADLVKAFDLEFGDVLSVVAQECVITIDCAPGVEVLRVLGREAEIDGQKVKTNLGHIYGKQDKYVVLEVKVPAGQVEKQQHVADVKVAYADLSNNERAELSQKVAATYARVQAEVEKSMNEAVQVSVVRQIGAENNRRAMELRDQGQVKEAEETLVRNAAYLGENAERYDSEWLTKDARANEADALNLAPGAYAQRRKSMIDSQSRAQMQSLGYIGN